MLKVIKVVSLGALLSILLQGCGQQSGGDDNAKSIQVEASPKKAVEVKQQKAKQIKKKKLVEDVVLAPLSEYDTLYIQGWKVMVSPRVQGHDKNYTLITKQLGKDFKKIINVVPDDKLTQLQKTTVWVEQGMPSKRLNSTFFNGSRKSTKKLGLIPESYGGIIIGNTQGYLNLARARPWQMLHELTHAYHQFVIKHNFAPVVEAFANTKQYDLHSPAADKRINGSGYPTRNKKEYLSELTVAYFGRKIAFPHDRKQLALYDPLGYCAVVKTWDLVGKQKGDVPLRCDS